MILQSLPAIILADNQKIPNDWHLLHEIAGTAELSELSGKNILVPLGCWQLSQDYLKQRPGLTGVWLDSGECATNVLLDSTLEINSIPMIALRFPVFTDGRNYSSARALRQTFGYRGDIMAFGDVLRDQACFLRRCGINIFAPRADQNIDDFAQALNDFADAYQPNVTQPLPLFRRRESA
jgi:uncharacterized protein (DUF934 family)